MQGLFAVNVWRCVVDVLLQAGRNTTRIRSQVERPHSIDSVSTNFDISSVRVHTFLVEGTEASTC